MKTFIVLGMHRSATSLAAGALHNFGVHMGDKMIPADWSNPKGHWENSRFMHLNQRILASAGGSWCNPPAEDAVLAQKNIYEPEIKKLVKQSEQELWGWKDPRTIFTIKLYLPHVTNPHFVCCFRDPFEVAKSLNVRNNFPIEKGLELAEIYNKRLIKFLSETYI